MSGNGMTENCIIGLLLGFAALGFAGLYIWHLRQRLAMTPQQKLEDDDETYWFR